MTESDFGKFFSRYCMAISSIHDFLRENNLRSDTVIHFMMRINYIIEEKGECYAKDIRDMYRDEDKKADRRVNLILFYTQGNRFIKSLDKDPKLGYRYELTNKGRNVLTRFNLFLMECENEYFYKLKKSRMEARNYKKK